MIEGGGRRTADALEGERIAPERRKGAVYGGFV